MVVKRHDGGLIEVYASGKVKFRPRKFTRALGDKAGVEYGDGLKKMIPEAMRLDYPRLSPVEAARVAPALFDLVRKALEDAERPGGPRNVEG
jgi:hypothetical protein